MAASTTPLLHDRSRIPAGFGFWFDTLGDDDCQVYLYDEYSVRNHAEFMRCYKGDMYSRDTLNCAVIEADIFGVKIGVIIGCNHGYKKVKEIIEDYFGDSIEICSAGSDMKCRQPQYKKNPWKVMFGCEGARVYMYRPAVSREEKHREEEQAEKARTRERVFKWHDELSKHVDAEHRLIMKLGREALIDLELAKSFEETT